MRIKATSLPDVKILKPKVFTDDRGFFFESYNEKEFGKVCPNITFVQDNHSKSKCGVLRGIHYQVKKPQGKLVRVIAGAIYDVAVDLREDSPTFSHWVGIYLYDQSHDQLWIPPGFGHAFLAMVDDTEVLYKTTELHHSRYDRCIIWNDKTLNIHWPIDEPILSSKDRLGKTIQKAEL
jgi:dTDP-4-dehydrorhamnose 3,5-epimerase